MNEIENLDVLDDELPVVSQTLMLICAKCRAKARYDVGHIMSDPGGSAADGIRHHFFANYFRCEQCQSPGPWEIHSYLELTGITVRSAFQRLGRVSTGLACLFDGTVVQSPAMGEEHLKRLLENDPHSVRLHTRIGNLLRISGNRARAREWFEKALAIEPGAMEARFHLYRFAIQAKDWPGALEYARGVSLSLVIESEGENPDEQHLLDLISENFVLLRQHFEPLLRERILNRNLQPGDMDLMALFAAEDEASADEIQTQPASRAATHDQPSNKLAEPGVQLDQFVPSLREAVERAQLSMRRTLTVAIRTDQQNRISIPDRAEVSVYDGKKTAPWRVDSLRELFRGNESPPPDMSHYPEAYAPHFYFIEKQVITACVAAGDRTDHEFEEIYSNLRRRPDGRSLGPAHDAVWQIAALLLGTRPLSQAQFEAIFGQLARSTRRWKEGPSSRNYIAYIRKTFG